MEEKVFEIVLPVYDNSGNRIHPQLLKDVAIQMAERFRGVTGYPVAVGCYAPTPETLSCEQNVVFWSAALDRTAGELAGDYAFMEDLARRVGIDLGQEQMFVMEETADHARWINGRRLDSLPPSSLTGEQLNTASERLFERLIPDV